MKSSQEILETKIRTVPWRERVLSLSAMSWLELAALISSCAIAAFCAAFFVYISIPWIRFPADILMWSETAFLGDIIKLQTGLPFYTLPEQSNSLIYTPGAPWLSFVLLSFLKQPVSVPALRTLQFVYVAIATIVAIYNAHIMRRMSGLDERLRYKQAWFLLGILLLFLAATSPRVNRYVLMLHADALALLVSMVIWSVLLQYVRSPSTPRLLVLALMPAVGFAVKPFLLAWLPVIAVVLAILPFRNFKDHLSGWCALVGLATASVWGLISLFYAWWGHNFLFWVFQVMGGSRSRITLAGEFNIALLRSADHLFRAWWELCLGVIAAWLTLHIVPDRRMMALFAGWLTLVGFEVVTSGAGWHTMYHFGPGVLIGVTWLVAVLPAVIHLFDDTLVVPNVRMFSKRLLNASVFVVIIVSICIALRSLPSRDRNDDRWFPGVRPPEALYSQIRSIEKEFQGYSDGEVLLDVGNWVYLQSGFLALDRAVSLGDQPLVGNYENFKPLLERIRSLHYKKILVRNLHGPTFLYDYWQWKRPSGVRQALLEHYKEIKIIAGVEHVPVMFSGPVSVLVPRD